MLSGRALRAFLAVSLAILASLASVAPAQAGLGGSASCQPSATSEPFAAIGDPTTYELVPGGDFAGTLAGWSVQGGDALTSSGLSLSPGAVATSPDACVNVVHPAVRFYASATSPGTTIDVAAVLGSPARSVAVPLGSVTPTAVLAPTPQLVLRVPLLGTTAGGVLLSFRFEARGGTAQIDDVYVDPWRSG
jgi:hypothetical protein